MNGDNVDAVAAAFGDYNDVSSTVPTARQYAVLRVSLKRQYALAPRASLTPHTNNPGR